MKTQNGLKSGGLVTFSIKVNGAVPADLQVISIQITRKVNGISGAKIVMADGDPAAGTFAISSSGMFVPGAAITMEIGYDSRTEVAFRGFITGQALRIDESIGSALEVECMDAAVSMNIERKSRTYVNSKDSDIISSVIGNYPGIASSTASTTTVYPELVQYLSTDWEFILARARANGMIVTSLNGTVAVSLPTAAIAPVLSVKYGESILSFNAELNNLAEPGALYREFSKIQGKVKFQGSNLVNPGQVITLDGLGDRFNGNHIVSGIVQTIAGGKWTTEVSFGLSAILSAEDRAGTGSGILPTARGLFSGTVKKMSGDPDGQYRILVDVPLLDPFRAGIWVRLSGFYATNGAGAFFLPEIGDEVVLGFLNEDPHYPIILGSLYNNPAIKPYTGLEPNDKNSFKAIVSKSGISVLFDDENKVLTIATPNHNTVMISDRDKQITIKDQNANSIVMSTDGITIKSAKDINIEADLNIKLKGKTGIAAQSAEGDISLSAMNINETASMKYAATGAANAEVSSSGELKLQGAMILIN